MNRMLGEKAMNKGDSDEQFLDETKAVHENIMVKKSAHSTQFTILTVEHGYQWQGVAKTTGELQQLQRLAVAQYLRHA